jgi:membrane-associated phospholipid phosphatase
MTNRRRQWLVIGLWIALFAVALAADGPVARWVREARPIPRGSAIKAWVKPAGDFKYVAVLIPVLFVAHPARWRAGLALVLACALSGGFYATKWVFGRRRPQYSGGEIRPFALDPFTDGLPGFFYAKAMSFPSGHACLAFAAAACLAGLWPRGRVLVYAVASTVAVERVLEGAHYPSDVVAGAAFGILAARIALRLCDGWFGPAWVAGPPARAPRDVGPVRTTAATTTTTTPPDLGGGGPNA